MKIPTVGFGEGEGGRVFVIIFRDFLVFVLLFTCKVAERLPELNVLIFTLNFRKLGGCEGRRAEIVLISGIVQVSVAISRK